MPGPVSDPTPRTANATDAHACRTASQPVLGLGDQRRGRVFLLALGFVLAPVVILAGAWRLGGVSALEDDLLYYLPIRQYIGERIRAGEWPLWNPLVGMGSSLAADPQSGLWYLLTWLFVALPPLVAYSLTIILHFALAGWGMYRFLRALGRDRQAAYLGAMAFEFCGFLVAHRAHLTILEAAAWMPWIFFSWQRFADTGRRRYLGLAALVLGMQMLVQHVQVTIIACALLTAYVAFVLWPRRRSLAWWYPVGMLLGAGVAAVQILPTMYHLSASGRATPTYATFVENSWTPSSAIMMLFPMLFGNRTPGVWGQEWWGLSHFCEQSAYASIPILLLAGASAALLRRRTGSPLRREAWFWWGAVGVALVIALGDLTPVGRLLFHMPVYRSLRVPARWILVWSFSLPVLASAALTGLRSGGASADRLSKMLRLTSVRVLPAAAGLCLGVVLVARVLLGRLEATYGQQWGAATIFAGLRQSVRVGNPAVWWPAAMMVASVLVLRWWTHRQDGRSFAVLLGLMLLDLAGVAAFVDVDTGRYHRGDLLATPPLARAIRDLHPDPGHRLLVPRYQADYSGPLAVLWPETNICHGIPTFNAYGPFWPRANRLLFRFMPWGASEGMLEMMRQPALLASMGVRFIAARTPEEIGIMQAAMTPTVAGEAQEIAGPRWQPVCAGHDVLWPIRVEAAGIYELDLEAEPVLGSASQWFVRLETPDMRGIGFARRLEPVDLSDGRRRMTFLFVCPEVYVQAFVRIKSEYGQALSVRSATFRQVAGRPDELDGTATQPNSPFAFRGRTSDGVSLYELSGAAPLVRVECADASKHSDAGTVLAVERPKADRIRIRTHCSMRALLIFNESYDPGWRAAVNGRPVEVLRCHGVVQGVELPAGEASVEWWYRPQGLRRGGAISLVSLLAAMLFVLGSAGLFTKFFRSEELHPSCHALNRRGG